MKKSFESLNYSEYLQVARDIVFLLTQIERGKLKQPFKYRRAWGDRQILIEMHSKVVVAQ